MPGTDTAAPPTSEAVHSTMLLLSLVVRRNDLRLALDSGTKLVLTAWGNISQGRVSLVAPTSLAYVKHGVITYTLGTERPLTTAILIRIY